MKNLLYIAYNYVIYSFFGWALEEVYSYIVTGRLKEDGFLSGPFKPMYGVASIIIIYCYKILKIRGISFAIIATIVPTAVELLSGLILKRMFNKQYWHYENISFNYQGLICLKFSLYWAILIMTLVKFILPITDYIYYKAINIFEYLVPIFIVYLFVDLIATIDRLNRIRI